MDIEKRGAWHPWDADAGPHFASVISRQLWKEDQMQNSELAQNSSIPLYLQDSNIKIEDCGRKLLVVGRDSEIPSTVPTCPEVTDWVWSGLVASCNDELTSLQTFDQGLSSLLLSTIGDFNSTPKPRRIHTLHLRRVPHWIHLSRQQKMLCISQKCLNAWLKTVEESSGTCLRPKTLSIQFLAVT